MNSRQPTGREREAATAAGFGGAQPTVVASNYKAIGKNTLIATADLSIPHRRLTFRGCLWHRKGDREWINFPAREWIDRGGAKQYGELIRFTDCDTFDRFQTAALAAIHAVAGEGER